VLCYLGHFRNLVDDDDDVYLRCYYRCICCVSARLDTDKPLSSPQHHRCTAADRSALRDNARRTSSPARCPGLGKSSPASGKTSPPTSPIADSVRRRRAADHRNSPRHATNGSVGSRDVSLGRVGTSTGQSSANRQSARSDGVQSASSCSAPALDRPSADSLPAIHSARHLAVAPVGHSAVQVKRRPERHDGVQCDHSVTSQVAAADDVKQCTKLSDTNTTSQVTHRHTCQFTWTMLVMMVLCYYIQCPQNAFCFLSCSLVVTQC